MATASPPGPSQLADTAAITLPKIDAIASGAVKDMLKTGMSESEEVLEYLGGSVAYDLKAAAAKAATRRDLALGPKSKLDGAALNASMDELDRRAKAVAPFWVGPGVDDAPPQAAAAPALKKKAESPAKESAPLATATKAAAPTPAKPKPPPPKAELTPAKPKPPPPAPKKAPADAPKKMAMPELPKVKLPAVDVKLPSIPAPTIPVPELDGVAEDAIRAIRVAMSRAPKYDDDGDGDGAGGFNFAPNVSDGIDKDDPDYREMVKTRRRRPPRAASLPAPPTPEEKEARRLERARLRREREERRAAEDAEREATAAKKIADALAAPPQPDPAWMTAKGTDILAAVESVVAKHPKGEAVKKPPSAEKAPPAKDATKGKRGPDPASSAAEKTEVPGPTGAELFDRYAMIVQDKLEDVAKNLGLADQTPEDQEAATKARLEKRAREVAKAKAAADKAKADAAKRAEREFERERAAKRAAAEKEEKEKRAAEDKAEQTRQAAAKAKAIEEAKAKREAAEAKAKAAAEERKRREASEPSEPEIEAKAKAIEEEAKATDKAIAAKVKEAEKAAKESERALEKRQKEVDSLELAKRQKLNKKRRELERDVKAKDLDFEFRQRNLERERRIKQDALEQKHRDLERELAWPVNKLVPANATKEERRIANREANERLKALAHRRKTLEREHEVVLQSLTKRQRELERERDIDIASRESRWTALHREDDELDRSIKAEHAEEVKALEDARARAERAAAERRAEIERDIADGERAVEAKLEALEKERAELAKRREAAAAEERRLKAEEARKNAEEVSQEMKATKERLAKKRAEEAERQKKEREERDAQEAREREEKAARVKAEVDKAAAEQAKKQAALDSAKAARVAAAKYAKAKADAEKAKFTKEKAEERARADRLRADAKAAAAAKKAQEKAKADKAKAAERAKASAIKAKAEEKVRREREAKDAESAKAKANADKEKRRVAAEKAKAAAKAKRKADIRAGKDESHKRIDASVLAALALGAAGAVLLANVLPRGGADSGGKKKKKTAKSSGSKSGASTPGSVSGVSDVTLGSSLKTTPNTTPRTDLTPSGSHHLEVTNYPSSLNTTPAGTGTPFSITGTDVSSIGAGSSVANTARTMDSKQSSPMKSNRSEKSDTGHMSDLDDQDLVSPPNTARSGEEGPGDANAQAKKERTGPRVPKLPLFRLFGRGTPPGSAKEPEPARGPPDKPEDLKQMQSNAGGQSQTAPQQAPSPSGGKTSPSPRFTEMQHELANEAADQLKEALEITAARAAEALASEVQLKFQLEEARRKMKSLEERQATLLTVVERERAAKLRAIEQAAGVAAAAETLAESAPGADPQTLTKTAKDAAADTYEDAMFSPSTRDADAGVALDAMDAKAKAQLDKADAALARLTQEKFAAERRMADERAAWESALAAAHAREAELAELLEKQKTREKELASRRTEVEAEIKGGDVASSKAAAEKAAELRVVTAAAESEIAEAQRRASELGEELALATSRVEKRERDHADEVQAAVAHAQRTMETVAAAAAADLEAANAKNAQLRIALAEKEAQERSLRERLAEATAAVSQQSISANTSTAFSDAASDFKTDPLGSEYNSASQSVPPSDVNTPETSPRDSEPSAISPVVEPLAGGGTPFMTPGAILNTPGGSAYASAKSTPVHSARGGPGGGVPIPPPPKFGESPSKAELRLKATRAEARAEATERALAGERAELERIRKEIATLRVEQGAWEKAASPVTSPAKPSASERERRVREATAEALREAVRVALASGVNEAELREAMMARGVDVDGILDTTLVEHPRGDGDEAAAAAASPGSGKKKKKKGKK